MFIVFEDFWNSNDLFVERFQNIYHEAFNSCGDSGTRQVRRLIALYAAMLAGQDLSLIPDPLATLDQHTNPNPEFTLLYFLDYKLLLFSYDLKYGACTDVAYFFYLLFLL